MEGVSHEALFAGRYIGPRVNRFFYDDNGSQSMAMYAGGSLMIHRRVLRHYGWQVIRGVDGHDALQKLKPR